jgi:ATP-dependent Clp protease ATP-binding subunit ClpC
VDRLLDTSDTVQVARFANPFRTWRGNCWSLFTEMARRAVLFSQEEAVRWGENLVSTEHLLLGLVREELFYQDPATGERFPAAGQRVLTEEFGLSGPSVRDAVERHLTPGAGHDDEDLQLTPRAKRVIDLAYDEARLRWNDFIGTGHLLLGMIRERESMAGQVLADLGITLEQARPVVAQIQENG